MQKTLTLLLVLWPLASVAATPDLEGLLVTNNQRSLLLYVAVKDAFPEEVLSSLRNGLPLTLVFEVQLHRERQMWPDRLMGSYHLSHSLTYDVLKEEYAFVADYGDGPVHKSSKDPLEVQGWMARLNGAAFAPLQRIANHGTYYVEVRARVLSPQPLFSRTILFFFRRDGEFRTDWVRSPLFSFRESSAP